MQPEPTSTAAPSTGTPHAAGGGGQGGLGAQLQMFAPLILMFVVFYFLLLRPQQKKQRETDDLLKSLKKGDSVRTTGGIRGEITDINDAEVTLLIAEKVKINVLRAHIASKITAQAAGASKDK
ncbi:MAG TPA: preprotein translocase subunit YajC [Polyangiales bacterium]